MEVWTPVLPSKLDFLCMPIRWVQEFGGSMNWEAASSIAEMIGAIVHAVYSGHECARTIDTNDSDLPFAMERVLPGVIPRQSVLP
jgi:hypothetical protein